MGIDPLIDSFGIGVRYLHAESCTQLVKVLMTVPEISDKYIYIYIYIYIVFVALGLGD